MPSLRSRNVTSIPFWKGRSPFADKDGDGYPDHVELRIAVSPDLKDPHVWAGVLNLVARIAFEVISFQPPLVVARSSLPSAKPCLMILPPGRRAPGRETLLPAELWQADRTTTYLSGYSGRSMMAILNGLASSGIRANSIPEDVLSDTKRKDSVPAALDLLNLAGASGLYRSLEDNPRFQRLDAALFIGGSSLSPVLGLSLCDLLARIVLEATEITLPMAFAGKPEGARTAFSIRETSERPAEIRLLPETGSLPQRIQIKGDPEDLARALREWAQWALLTGGRGFDRAEIIRNRVTQFRDLLHCNSPLRIVSKGGTALRPKALHLQFKWKGEISRVLDLVRSVPRSRGEIMGEVLVSKPLKVRRRLKAGLERLLRQKGYDPRIKVLNAYKPGLSWLLEEILPELEKLSPLNAIELSYRPYAPAGKALEMRSRWLQELFPGPELVARSLSLDRSRIRISRRTRQKNIYEVRALSSKGEILFQSGFTPSCAELHYLSREPEMGFVHPTTGRITLVQGDRVVLHDTVQSDRELFWLRFQKHWLPLLEKHMVSRITEKSFHGQIAFWKEIQLNVFIHETDERLALTDERVCPMETLHEDLYFVLLDAFSSFAKRQGLPDTLHLGRIIPRVSSKDKGGSPFAELTAKPLAWDRLPADCKESRSDRSSVSSLTFENGEWGVELRESSSDALLDRARSRGFEVNRTGNNRLLLRVKTPQFQKWGRKARLLKGRKPALNRLLKAREVFHWIERLGRLDCIEAWKTSHSLQGRTLWAVEAVLKKKGALTSIARMRLLKPSFLFNARHHANEVSSTNATLIMAYVLGTTPLGKQLLKHVNVAWIPLENPDGTATLEELLTFGRDHILHAARYNALGVETYGEYFDDQPRFPEALAKARLWRRWLPEVMVDHHGVPGHEWNQPFSGYAPFRFREFWIPRNFVYACIPFVNESDHPHHRLAKGLAALLAKAMTEVPEIVRRNREISSLYRRYARGPEPQTFPDSKGEPLLVLPPMGRTYHTNFAVRCPEVTRSEIILEVPDEGASGRSLGLCVQAHLKAEEALLKAFRRPKGRIEATLESETQFLRFRWVPGRQISRGSTSFRACFHTKKLIH